MADKPARDGTLGARRAWCDNGITRQTRRLTRTPINRFKERQARPLPVSDTSDSANKKSSGARVTLRLSERELSALRELAESREEDLTAVIREAIAAYLHDEQQQAAHRTEHEQLATQLIAGVKREADRVIDRHEQTTRALIAALNEHLGRKP